MKNKNQTIYAMSTPSGKSAIALIRISGYQSYKLVKSISKRMPTKTNVSSFNELVSLNGSTIDHTITTYFKSPKSYTGEDMVEISTHGSSAVINKIIKTLSDFGEENIRLALPGEFTRRAFENNKLDLTQVEAIADIVNAETEMQRKQAISHLSGHFFNSAKLVFDNLKKVLANIEAIIDFSEEDLPGNLINEIKEQIENSIEEINSMLRNSSTGISIREGFLAAILGKPNTGKSSFINIVSGRDVSIVTSEPGTTRDLIESFVDLGGYPVKFVDTAGIRGSKNVVEKIGIEKALLTSKEADINIVFIEKKDDIVYFKDIKNPIYVKAKQDLYGGNFEEVDFYNISNKNKFGIKDILLKIQDKIHNKALPERAYISRERHKQCLATTLKHLKESKKEKSTDLFAEDIRLALKNLSSLFGNVDIEDILDIIFSDFCIGK